MSIQVLGGAYTTIIGLPADIVGEHPIQMHMSEYTYIPIILELRMCKYYNIIGSNVKTMAHPCLRTNSMSKLSI
jgi:hypothetical protein